MNRKSLWMRPLFLFPLCYAGFLCFDLCFGIEAPVPGSPGDTLTREDKRMAYLVYHLLDSNGMIKGADMERGEALFMRNCMPCHGDDGRRMNVSQDMRRPAYIGTRAKYDMPTFWHQMNFGDSTRGMLPYYDEIELRDMIDLAGFAQTLPTKPWSSKEKDQ